ncbi:MAG: ABC transporter ATP-binding protein/permease [Spirochaetes bacterium]|nr:ABC transporter ATP-binding protein/permease [Spirochaetota bacterium]MBU1082117.1 ABC transporter ATP-binding protein/permease [Spirochaetota bacterium]
MPDFFDADDIVKSYDGTIVRRIFSYVKPYRRLLAVATLTLALSTAGELVLPVLVQRTVDDALVVSWASVAADSLADPRLAGLDIPGDAPRAGGRAFVRESGLASLTQPDKRSLEADGILDPGPYYLCAKGSPGDLPEAVARDLGADGGPRLVDGWLIAPSAYARALSPGDAKSLRAADRLVVAGYGWALLAVLVVVLLSTFGQAWTTSLIGQNVMKDLRMDLFRRTSGQSLAFLSKQPVGRLVTRLTGDVETINEFFTSVVVSFIKDASVMAGALVVLLAMSPRLGLIAIATLPPVLAATGVSRRKARDAFRRQRTWLSKVNAFLAEHIAGIAVVKLFGRERASADEFAARDAELMRANLGEMYVFAVFRPLIEFFSSVSVAIVLWFGAGLHGKGLISLGALIAFVNLIRMFYSPLQDISEKYTILQSAMAGGERVFKLLDADERVPDEPRSSLSRPVKGRIEFDRVWFAYKGDDWVIRDLSFAVEPGETVAIVGYTGAGKSTVGSLLARLWDPQRGEIRLDGVPIRELPLSELRSSIRPVMQDVFLFSGTVAGNIDLGLGLGRPEVERAAKAVMAHGFIESLDGGYDAPLGEGAATLSSGQRQLLSFARVVAHDPAIVVLDEATSSVDTETERLLQGGLSALMRGRTTVAIAHRLSTIRHADRILVLADGRLVETGDHDSLIAEGGIYYNLYRLQYQGEATTAP